MANKHIKYNESDLFVNKLEIKVNAMVFFASGPYRLMVSVSS